MEFELTNKQREYLGLELVEEYWKKVQLSNKCYVYFDGDVVKKRIDYLPDYYRENQMNEETSNEQSILLPKTKRGKEKKLTASNIMDRMGYGNYFIYNDGEILIANITTQQTYYTSDMACTECNGIDKLDSWLENWIANINEEHMQEMEKFKTAKKVHCKYKEGDFFRFKIDCGKYGYGRILFNFDRLRKEKIPFWDIMFGKPLVIKVYHIITEEKFIDLKKLQKLPAIPAQHIMDNVFYYGEYEIIGNLQLEENELDSPIMYGSENNKIIFQQGPVYKLIDFSSDVMVRGNFRNSAIGFTIRVYKNILEECINKNSNLPYWNQEITKDDLRNPTNTDKYELILKQFSDAKCVTT